MGVCAEADVDLTTDPVNTNPGLLQQTRGGRATPSEMVLEWSRPTVGGASLESWGRCTQQIFNKMG